MSVYIVHAKHEYLPPFVMHKTSSGTDGNIPIAEELKKCLRNKVSKSRNRPVFMMQNESDEENKRLSTKCLKMSVFVRYFCLSKMRARKPRRDLHTLLK